MNIGKTTKIIQQPDVLPVEWPKPKPAEKPIPAPDWPKRKKEPAVKEPAGK